MKNLALFSGWIVFLALHLFRLAQVPGLHFDEAWAFTHARSIAQGGFTLKAMSPYTMPWTHYWAALFLWFSNSLWAFRFSQIVLAFGGLAFVHFSLSTERRVWLPWILLLIPGLFFNHRFAIELNGLHVFTFGLGLWALQQGRFGLAAFAWVLGTTAHILFYPWGLAVCAAYLGEGNALTEHHRRTLRWSAFVFFIFFTSVVLQIPEKGKGLALCFSALSIGVFTYVDKLPQTIALGGVSKKVLPLVAIPFLANAIFFGQGSWSYATQTGILLWEKTYYLLFYSE